MEALREEGLIEVALGEAPRALEDLEDRQLLRLITWRGGGGWRYNGSTYVSGHEWSQGTLDFPNSKVDELTISSSFLKLHTNDQQGQKCETRFQLALVWTVCQVTHVVSSKNRP